MPSLELLKQEIEACERCPRLRLHCKNRGLVKRAAYQSETYAARPVAGFGDPDAAVVIVGLAPGAHGANRTGRIFTGDQSGLWLYRALHRAGLSNQSESVSVKDGLVLSKVFITCAVKCAPPQNKPSPLEIKTCASYFVRELELLAGAKVYIALGSLAYDRLFLHLGIALHFKTQKLKKPKFKHGAVIEWRDPVTDQARFLLLSYHPSQQNTFTKKLTELMFDRIFESANRLLGLQNEPLICGGRSSDSSQF